VRDRPNLENTGQPIFPGKEQRGTYDADIDAVEAFAAGHTGDRVVVAIIGTGFRWSGSTLRPVLWRNSREIPGNGIDDDGNGLVDDYHGYDFGERDNDPHSSASHDLTVAEMAVAPHDRRSVAGIAPQAELIVIKIADDSGRILMAPLPQALAYALRNGARVIFMPWSAKGRECGRPEYAIVSQFLEAAARHSLIIGGRPGEWPACLPGVVSVRPSRPDDRSEGAPASDVDFAAPGADGRTRIASSYAIGVAAGAAALLFGQDPTRTPAQVRQLLARTSDRVHPEIRPYRGGWNSLFGAGRINVARALETDFDGDGILDADDPDADGDEIPDERDPCTLDPDPGCTTPARVGE
jgi:subtilisin family serine protease